jgi:hypothetical protein
MNMHYAPSPLADICEENSKKYILLGYFIQITFIVLYFTSIRKFRYLVGFELASRLYIQ